VDEIPITAEKVLKGLELKRQGKTARVGPDRVPLFTFKAAARRRVRVRRAADAIAVRPFAGRRVMIRLPAFEYLTPRTVGDAVKYLADRGPDAMLVAGGTDLFRT